MIGDSFRNSQHRIESRDMKGRRSGHCITDINLSGFPFSIFTTNTWARDTFLRLVGFQLKLFPAKKCSLFLSRSQKKTAFWRASLFILGRSYFVRALETMNTLYVSYGSTGCGVFKRGIKN